MENIDKFKVRLKELRKEKSMRQEDLANKLGIVRSAIANYETGRTIPDSETLNVIANTLDTTTDYLLGRTDNPHSKVDQFLIEIKKELKNQGIEFDSTSPKELAEALSILRQIRDKTKSN